MAAPKHGETMPGPKQSSGFSYKEAGATIVPVQRLQTIGEVALGQGGEDPRAAALRVIADYLNQADPEADVLVGTYQFPGISVEVLPGE